MNDIKLVVLRNPNSPLSPSPLLKVEPASGLDCSGISKPRRISAFNGPAAGGRLCTAQGAKGQGTRSRRDRLSLNKATNAPKRFNALDRLRHAAQQAFELRFNGGNIAVDECLVAGHGSAIDGRLLRIGHRFRRGQLHKARGAAASGFVSESLSSTW